MTNIGNPSPRRPGLVYRMMMSFIGLFDRWLHLSCRSFIQLASEKHERPLSRTERFRQGVHRLMCSICRVQEKRMDQLRSLARDVGRFAAEDSRDHLAPDAEARIRQAMIDAAGAERDDKG